MDAKDASRWRGMRTRLFFSFRVSDKSTFEEFRVIEFQTQTNTRPRQRTRFGRSQSCPALRRDEAFVCVCVCLSIVKRPGIREHCVHLLLRLFIDNFQSIVSCEL